MKFIFPIFAIFASILLATVGCSPSGPSEAELRVELQSIDSELMSLRNAAYHHQSQMNQDEFAVFISSFAVGYGATSGDYGLAGDGVRAAAQASASHDSSNYSLQQIRSRSRVLHKRRGLIITQLK